MEIPFWIPLLSGLLGALIGSASSLGAVFIQTRAQKNRDQIRLIVEAATEEYKGAKELMKLPGGPRNYWPLSVYIYYHTRFLNLIEENRLSPESMEKMDEEMSRVYEVCMKPVNIQGSD